MHTILEGIVGSRAYGTHHEGSDFDFLGVFSRNTKEYLGLDTPEESVVTKFPDTTRHDAAKYCRLALKCNPTVMELLWLPSHLYTVQTELGNELIKIRTAFLSASYVKNAYLGYAESQLKRLKTSDSPKEKAALHLVRLLVQGSVLHKHGELMLKLAAPDVVKTLAKQIVQNPSQADHLLRQTEQTFSEPGILPEQPDTAKVQNWLLAVRDHYYFKIEE